MPIVILLRKEEDGKEAKGEEKKVETREGKMRGRDQSEGRLGKMHQLL